MPTLVNRVVVHTLDGAVIKGVTRDFYPNRPTFHVSPADKGKDRKIDCRTLKAIFFVHDFRGDSRREDRAGFLGGPAETMRGGKVAVLFRDGELVCGYSMGYSDEKDGFFLFPADSEGNNARIYVFRVAAQEIAAGAEADALAKRVMEKPAA